LKARNRDVLVMRRPVAFRAKAYCFLSVKLGMRSGFTKYEQISEIFFTEKARNYDTLRKVPPHRVK
jgi:hypothetical protein